MQQGPATDHHPWRSRSSVSPSLLYLEPEFEQAADGRLFRFYRVPVHIEVFGLVRPSNRDRFPLHAAVRDEHLGALLQHDASAAKKHLEQKISECRQVDRRDEVDEAFRVLVLFAGSQGRAGSNAIGGKLELRRAVE